MARYKCVNEECLDYGTITKEFNVWSKYVGAKLVDMIAPCPECKKDRIKLEEKQNKGFCTTMKGGNGNICNK